MAIGGDTRERIKAEATRLFVAKGVDGVSIRDIADVVGMKPSNLYAHFRSRDALIDELFREGYGDYCAQLRAVADAAAPFAERLETMIRLVCRLHDQDGARFQFLLMNQHLIVARLPDDLPTPFAVVTEMVTAAAAAGEISAPQPTLLAAMIIGVVLEPAAFHAYGRLSGGLCAVADDLVDACLRLLR